MLHLKINYCYSEFRNLCFKLILNFSIYNLQKSVKTKLKLKKKKKNYLNLNFGINVLQFIAKQHKPATLNQT